MVSTVPQREQPRSNMPSKTVDCPLCGVEVNGENIECSNGHPPVLLSWIWSDTSVYESFYRTTTYHENQYKINRGRTCQELYGEARNASKERLRFLEPFRTKATNHLLDIGAGSGAFRDEADFQGYHAVGIDPNPIGTVNYGEWKDVGGHWDLITMFDVLEHLLDPRACLLYLRECLSSDGLVVIEMPEYQAPSNWERHKKPREHLCLWSKPAFEQLVSECGYDIVMFHRPLRGSLGKMCFYLAKEVS